MGKDLSKQVFKERDTRVLLFGKSIALIILWFSKLVASDQHGLVMLSIGYLIYVPSMCKL